MVFHGYINNKGNIQLYFISGNCLAKIQKDCIFAPASPTRPAPTDSSRVGTQQRYVVERCDVGRLPSFSFLQ